MKFLQNKIYNLTIKKKLISISMATSITAVVFSCLSFVLFSIVEERIELVDEIDLVAEILGDELSSSLKFGDLRVQDSTFDHLKLRKSIEIVCIYDDKDDQIAKYIRTRKRISCDSLPHISRKYEFFHEHTLSGFLVVSSDLELPGGKDGAIYILANLNKINESINHTVLNSFMLIIFISIIAYLISNKLQNYISKPIRHLAEVAYLVKGGNFEIRAFVKTNDELGRLTEAFNNMLDKLENNQKNLELKVKERTQDLEKALKIKTEFLSNMSHEIRTPIHGILNYADFLINDWDMISEKDKLEFVKKLNVNSDRLLTLINNLLDLSKLEADKMQFHKETSDFAHLMEEVFDECKALYVKNNSLEVNLNYDKSLDYKVRIDYNKILQVVRNLISNSIKFTKEGSIDISFEITKYKIDEKKQKVLYFKISDNGLGIPDHELEYIFHKFNQSAKTRTGAGGTGLGLAICREIISFHHGVIWAENNKSGGSSFNFVIPV